MGAQMIDQAQADPLWLQKLLETAVQRNWCLRINCTTCPSEKLRLALGLMEKRPDGRPNWLPMSEGNALTIVEGLAHCRPASQFDPSFEEATRWVLYEVWRAFGSRYDSRLSETWAGEVLQKMRAHDARRTEARRRHDERQGVKQKDWKD